MLGEYSQDMQDAPYILEGLVENWEDEHSAEVIIKSPFLFQLCFMHSFIFITLYSIVLIFLSCVCLVTILPSYSYTRFSKDTNLSIEQVRLHLLTAVMKCFFKRPPETQGSLGAALAAGLADFHQVHVAVVC